MDKIGLVTAGSHVGYDQLTQNLEDVIAYSQTLGADYIVCPGARPKPGEDAASGGSVLLVNLMRSVNRLRMLACGSAIITILMNLTPLGIPVRIYPL